MAAANLLALIDDIATILDDVAILSKVAAKKTAGVLGDDLALNAQQVAGVTADREIPVVWAVAKGSFRNKAILVPAALLISAVIPWAIIPMLMVGGAYLCYEGFEKIAHRWLHGADDAAREAQILRALADPAVDLVQLEADKIRGAIRTDFILSAEIIVIALGIVADSPFMTQVGVLSAIAVLMTVGVYGLVAGIVKLDDLGLLLSRQRTRAVQAVGVLLLKAAPWLMKALSVLGTAAMFLVGGGIITHGIPPAHHAIESLGALVAALANGLTGLVVGALVLAAMTLLRRLAPRRAGA
jgi:hypothetical protein